jgi:NADPH-dependent 2,4-dienoyl-CoA reductase/sulfur reductase-like enzyme
LIGNEEPGPVDRPNLSKDYLAGTAPEEWVPLRDRAWYESIGVELIVGETVAAIERERRLVRLENGRTFPYGALLLATGAAPRTIGIAGESLPHVFRLRTFSDSRAIIAQAGKAKRACVIGTSFIGMEVAAALRHRGLDVVVIGPELQPFARILGPDLGRFIRDLHEQNGVRFHLGAKPRRIREDAVELESGAMVEAGLVVVGVGVTPRTGLAQAAGLRVDNGVVVDEMLRADGADVYAAGDIARYPDPISGESARIEHWVVAERQGQAVARAMLGLGGPFRDIPFFWTQHYDIPIAYAGHAPSWDSAEVRGDFSRREASVVYRRAGRVLAVATVGLDSLSLKVEAAMQTGNWDEVEAAIADRDRT